MCVRVRCVAGLWGVCVRAGSHRRHCVAPVVCDRGQSQRVSITVSAELRRPNCMVSCAIHINVLGGPTVVAIVHALSEPCVFGVPVKSLPFTRNAGMLCIWLALVKSPCASPLYFTYAVGRLSPDVDRLLCAKGPCDAEEHSPCGQQPRHGQSLSLSLCRCRRRCRSRSRSRYVVGRCVQEGIFRVAADDKEVRAVRKVLNQGETPTECSAKCAAQLIKVQIPTSPLQPPLQW